MKERLLNKFGPNSAKDAEETWRKLQSLHGNHRGWDVYLATLDSLVEVLTKTPVRDTANNPVMEPVPIRPHQPVPLPKRSLPPMRNRVASLEHSASERPNHEPSPHQYSTQEQRHACTRLVNVPTILHHPGAAISPNGPREPDLD
jgi:hypothetical protein